MTTPDFPALLAAAIARDGLRGFARRAGVSAPFVARVRDGQSAPGPAILAALGWERVVSYRPTSATAALAPMPQNPAQDAPQPPIAP